MLPGMAPSKPFQKLLGNLLGRAYLEGVTEAEISSELVGRPGLDPGTLGLKVPCSSG
jgi:hypothetical protein